MKTRKVLKWNHIIEPAASEIPGSYFMLLDLQYGDVHRGLYLTENTLDGLTLPTLADSQREQQRRSGKTPIKSLLVDSLLIRTNSAVLKGATYSAYTCCIIFPQLLQI